MLYLYRSLLLIIGIFFALSIQLNAESVYQYSYFPKKIYKNQVFPVTVIGINSKQDQIPAFTFDPGSDIKPLSNKPLVINNNNDSFYTFYFKAKDRGIRVPALRITTSSNYTELPSGFVPLTALEPREDFCGVIAADMKVKNSQVSNYDETNHIVTLNIEANEANLEDMKLSTVEESGIEDILRDNAKVHGDFYAIIPTAQKELKFTYFNTIQHQYISLQIPVDVKDASVSAHAELNPKEDSFEQIKKFTLVTLTLFMFVMFLFKRDFFFLVVGVVSFITLLTLYIPHKTICIKQGAPLYILPTHTSTVSTYLDDKLEAPILGERKQYLKIETKQGIIGWVKNEDLCEN
ncbi:hypothetical protein PGH07_00575 [Sulfurovum sp. zt1-1]|uniref:Periplasmic protein n=1 Tax=Sulfurovum zhangzhouensis TaxID=3019067 RepID=A0ABT7QV56_9BACT|nr:hypothetical protein [Sulfurovum zhangzhouensis]MDM5270667.1 hypothetical protein [Sulfurovum zhangzhouensis]